MLKKVLVIVLLLYIDSLGFAGKKENRLLFFCASAIKAPMNEIIPLFEKETSGIKIDVTYGGSGGLLSQMELAHKGDIYLAAAPEYILLGEERKILIQGASKKIVYLIPSLIVQNGNPKDIRTLEDLSKPGVRLALPNPETVCAGLFGVELLEKNNLLEKVLPNVAVYTKSVEDAAALVCLKKADCVIGWDSLKSWNPALCENVAIAGKRIPRIAYMTGAVPVFSKDKIMAQKFLDFLQSGPARDIFSRWNYILDEKEAKRYAPDAEIGGAYTLPEEYFKLLKK